MSQRIFTRHRVTLRRRRFVAGAVVACTALGGSVVGAGLVGAHEDDPERTPLVLGECPENSTELPRSAVAWASLAALRQAHHVYSEKDRDGMYVERAYLANDASDRGEGAKRQCAETVQQRTVVVDLRFPAMEPSASMSQGTVYVARTTRGDEVDYRIWDRRR